MGLVLIMDNKSHVMSESKISCPSCGQHLTLDVAWSGRTLNCPACQKPFVVPQLGAIAVPPPPPPAAAPAPVGSGLRVTALASPHHNTPPPQAPTGATPYRGQAARESRISGLAIASLVLSILGCFGITAIAGIVCGHLARGRIRRDPSLTGAGLALAGLIIGYVALMLSIVWFIFVGINVAKGFKQMQQQVATGGFTTISNGIVVTQPHTVVTRSEPKTDLPVPAGAVAGTIKGQSFNYTKSELGKNMGTLVISDGKDFFADRQIRIFLFPKAGESMESRTWKINANGFGMNPHIHVSWKEGEAGSLPKTEIVTTGYSLELKTEAIKDGSISGSISLKISGKVPVELKGNFTAAVE